MSYWIYDIGDKNNPNCKSFRCDYLSDIKKLPTRLKKGAVQNGDTVSSFEAAPGSDCLCLEDSSIWVLGNEKDEWKKMSGSGSGSGGSSSGTNDYVDLNNKPQIEGVELVGNTTFKDLGIQNVEYDNLNTEGKTISAAINELLDKINELSQSIGGGDDVVEFGNKIE